MKGKTAQKILTKVKKDYEDISEDFNITRKSDWKEFHLFLDYIKDGSYLADLGCGNGRFYSFIHKHRKIKYVGVDNSPKLLKYAEEQLKNTKSLTEPKFLLGDLLNVPLKAAEIDVTVSIASLHHIPSREFRQEAIKEMFRILKKNGILIISVWNLFQPKYKKYIWKSRLQHILSFGKYDCRDTLIPWGKSGVKRYYYAFTPNELRKLLEENGFEIISEHITNNFVFICKKS